MVVPRTHIGVVHTRLLALRERQAAYLAIVKRGQFSNAWVDQLLDHSGRTSKLSRSTRIRRPVEHNNWLSTEPRDQGSPRSTRLKATLRRRLLDRARFENVQGRRLRASVRTSGYPTRG